MVLLPSRSSQSINKSPRNLSISKISLRKKEVEEGEAALRGRTKISHSMEVAINSKGLISLDLTNKVMAMDRLLKEEEAEVVENNPFQGKKD